MNKFFLFKLSSNIFFKNVLFIFIVFIKKLSHSQFLNKTLKFLIFNIFNSQIRIKAILNIYLIFIVDFPHNYFKRIKK
jgi:hypothetical protein